MFESELVVVVVVAAVPVALVAAAAAVVAAASEFVATTNFSKDAVFLTLRKNLPLIRNNFDVAITHMGAM